MGPVRIAEVSTVALRMPLIADFDVSYGTRTHYDKVVVKLRSDNGLVGYGEITVSPTNSRSGSDEIAIIRDALAPAVLGTDPTNPGLLHHLMDRATRRPGPVRHEVTTAKAALDMAAYDLAGKVLGVPVSTLLGGALRDRIPVVFSSIEISDPDETAKEALAAVELGFPKLKIKGGRDPDVDVARMAAVKAAAGDQTWVRLDVNEGYPNAAVAIAALRQMEPFGLALVESPLAGDDLYGLAKVCAALDTPVTIHQGLDGPGDAAALIHFGAADAFTLAVQSVGGLYRARQVALTAETFGIPVLIGASADLGISTAASAHLASVIHDLPYESDCRFPLRYVEDVLVQPLRIDEGYTDVPTGVGLGIEVDEGVLDRYRTPGVDDGS
jgi:L-alanine-DL-glutamate epimerase-like enolase superfamily enzyme